MLNDIEPIQVETKYIVLTHLHVHLKTRVLTSFQHPNSFHHVRHKQAVHYEPRCVLQAGKLNTFYNL